MFRLFSFRVAVDPSGRVGDSSWCREIVGSAIFDRLLMRCVESLKPMD